MNKLSNIINTILIVFILILGNTVGAQPYTLADVSGPYGFSTDGVITITDPSSGMPMPIPTTAVGQLVASGKDTNGDGLGEMTVVAHQNIGGFAVITYASAAEKPGTYSIVGPKVGLGKGKVEVKVLGQPQLPLGSLPAVIDASQFASPAVFEFSFVLGHPDGGSDIIMTSISTVKPGGQPIPIGAFVARGRSWPQSAETK